MDSIWMVLLLSLLPGAGNFIGGMLAEFGKTSQQRLNWALHAASGIVIAIVAIELIPEALNSLAGWWIALAFAAGGCTYVLVEWGIERIQRKNQNKNRTGMWMIYIAVAIDLISDGLMIGTGSAVSSSLAVVLAAGQVMADLPEGYAAVANFRDKNVPRKRRILLSASFFLFVIGAALGSYFLLRTAPEPAKLGALVFVAGLLTVAAVEDMMKEAHEAHEDSRRSILAFIGGFTLFTLVSAGMKSLLGGAGS